MTTFTTDSEKCTIAYIAKLGWGTNPTLFQNFG